MRDLSLEHEAGSAFAGRSPKWKVRGNALREPLGVLAIAVGALAAATPAVAGDLTITPSVEVRVAFSDNVDLDPKGDAQTAIISEVVPGVTTRSESARVTAALDATSRPGARTAPGAASTMP